MGERGSRTAHALIAIGCIWLAVGGLAIASHLGLRFAIGQLPEPANGNPNIARLVMEPIMDVLLPILLVALALGALVQTVKVLFSLVRTGARSPKPPTSRNSG